MNRVEYRNGEPVIILNGADFGVEGEYEFFVNIVIFHKSYKLFLDKL